MCAGDFNAARSHTRTVIWAVAGLGVSAIVAQLTLMREMLSAFSGDEMVLGIVLGNWLLLTGLGAWLGRWSGRLRDPVGALVGGLILIAVLPPAQVFLLRTLHNVVFIRGALVGPTESFLASLVLLSPYCLISGCLLTLGCRLLAGEGPQGIGRIYVADSIGSIVGGAAFTFVLVVWLDHFAILYATGFLLLVLAFGLALREDRRALAAAAAAVLALLAVTLAADPNARSTAAEYPGQTVLFRGNSPYGDLVVAESAGQFNFVENGVPVVSTNNVQQVEETVHYAMAQRPTASRVLLISGGVSGTAREILKYPQATVTYAELDPLILQVGRRFLNASLDDPRIAVVNTDGRLFLRLEPLERFDVVIVDAPDPTTAQLNRFYTREFLAAAKGILRRGGVVAFSLGHYENYVSRELGRLVSSADRTLKEVFRNVVIVPGGRIFFLASDGLLFEDIAGRLKRAGVRTQWMNGDYLDAMLAPDRMADMRRAAAVPAAVNSDLDPSLYRYQLLYRLSQFKVRFGILEGVLLVLLAAYVIRLRPAPLAVFASGFAASALEVVLLLGFQVLYGSVYQQVGLIVTTFMAGLAAGAWWANRRPPTYGWKSLAGLEWGTAGLAAVIPLVLIRLDSVGGEAPLWLVQTVVPGCTLVLAALVGMTFPLAARVQEGEAANVASRLYAADFVGAALGALLASMLLIPVLGVAATCLLTAVLNVVSGAVLLFRRV